MLVFFALYMQDPPAERISAIYRCPAAEAESAFWPRLVNDYAFDTYCIEPKRGPLALQVVQESKVKVRFIKAKEIDTKANMAWRNATIEFVNGKISPKAWLTRSKAAKATVHFLSNPKTPKLYDAMTGDKHRAVFGELLILSWPGRPCFTADDIWRTRYLPEPGRMQSWVLSMNDFLGPMMYGRSQDKIIATQQPEIVRADDKPGLLIFRYKTDKRTLTFYANNGPKPIELPGLDLDFVTGISRGLDLEGPNPSLRPGGFMEEIRE